MTMTYEDALTAWGRNKLIEQALVDAERARSLLGPFSAAMRRQTKAQREQALAETEATPEFQATLAGINASPVSVISEFDRGYGCCGPMAEGATAEVVIQGNGIRVTLDFEDFDFVKVLGEIVEAGGGTITS